LQGSDLSPQLQELGLELSQSGIVLLGRSSVSSLSGHFVTVLSSLTASNGRNLDGSIDVLGGRLGGRSKNFGSASGVPLQIK
jgi:hypothetical protein